ncbi:MAG: KGG domain-containing protein [Candidatus Nanoarchaeia archaeon]
MTGNEVRKEAGRKGGEATAASHDREFYEEIGHKGGVAAQRKGTAHKLTDEERSKGGSRSGGNFKFDRERAAEAGRS